jgi:phage-related baseplate assembly protein
VKHHKVDKAASARGGKSPRLPQKDREVRQEIVLMKTICGVKAAEIAKELNTSLATVKTDLLEARRSGMVMVARDRLVGMIPKALAVLDTCLDDGDKDVALVVLEGLGIIGKHMQITMATQVAAGTESFDVFRARVIRAKETTDSTPTPGSGFRAIATAGPIIDAVTEAASS